MKTKYRSISLNLQQDLLYEPFSQSTTCQIIAVRDRHNKVICIRPEYSPAAEEITWFWGNDKTYKTIYGDSFHVDTWDERIKNTNK